MTASKEFASDRMFKVWGYSVSHSRLLLRSPMEDGYATRIDLFFARVARMLLRPSYAGLRAAVAEPAEVAQYRDRYGEVPEGYTLFTLEPGLASFVVAGVMQTHEDEGSYLERSYFGFGGQPAE
jgi:hypothetical protein